MISLFLGLTALNLLCLAVAAFLGHAGRGANEAVSLHLLVGVAATMVCCGVHCVVFTYFIATAKWVRHAVAVKNLDPGTPGPTRSFKAQAFPAALVGMGVVFVAAMAGAAVDNYGVAKGIHGGVAWGAWGVNLVVAVVEYRAIWRNQRLIDGVLERIRAVPGMV